MRIQITLTVTESKRLIAKGIAERADVKHAYAHGNILLKGGTTVSAICEELSGKSLRISGRVTPSGTKSSEDIQQGWHCALMEKGFLRDIDGKVGQEVSKLRKDDIVVLGANVFDAYGNAAMMMGRALGGDPGPALAGMMAEVSNVIIAVGVEKFAPGNLNRVIADTGRAQVDMAMGMAVGLIPICGEIYTELEAIKTLAKVEPLIIGRGGIRGAEGAATYIIDGDEAEVLKIFKLVESLKGARESGSERSFEECRPGKKCKFHLACVYSKKNKYFNSNGEQK